MKNNFSSEPTKKALRCMLGLCNNGTVDVLDCRGCAFNVDGQMCYENCSEGIAKASLDIISKQESEIERLKAILNSYALQYGTVADKSKILKQVKSEARKDLAERLKEHCEALASDEWNQTTSPSSWAGAYECFIDDIDNLVEESKLIDE